MSNLIIVRGLPGTGKSTFIREKFPGILHLETDMFNMCGGQYIWNMTRSSEAIRLIKDIFNMSVESPNKPDIALCGVYTKPDNIIDNIVRANECGYNIYIKTLNHEYGTIHNLTEKELNMLKWRYMEDDLFLSLLESLIPDIYPKIKINKEFPVLNWKQKNTD